LRIKVAIPQSRESRVRGSSRLFSRQLSGTALAPPGSAGSTAAVHAGVLLAQLREVESVAGQRNFSSGLDPSPIARVVLFAADLTKVLPNGSNQVE